MSVPMVRRIQPNGEYGPLEPAFPQVVNIDPIILMLTEAIAGLQEQVMLQQEEIKLIKGGGE